MASTSRRRQTQREAPEPSVAHEAAAALALLTVKGTGTDRRVAFWEQDAEHPGGEAFVVNDGAAVRVARTSGIAQALQDQRIVEAPDAPAEPEEPAEPETGGEADAE